jgi:hypothetical protein
MNKPTVNQFFLVFIILIILNSILNYAISYFYVDNMIKKQIIFLIVIAAGYYAWQKLGVQTCMSLSQSVILVATLFIMTDVLLYFLHVNSILAITVPFIISLIGIRFLRKHGYLTTKCKINNNIH